MKDLVSILGRELSLSRVVSRLDFWAREQRAPVYGALHVTCSDESEKECIKAFTRGFAEHLLPNLKFGEGSHFRIANLGGRYEWGAVATAEEHFATQESRNSFKVFVVKINGHVAVYKTRGGVEYGHKARYGHDSAYCGALNALLAGSSLPAIKELEELFAFEGKDRLAVLRDPEQVNPRYRALFAALVAARLQARRVILDIQHMTQNSPTLFLVVPCVTLNRDTDDTEVVCGYYRADMRSDDTVIEYRGLGDDPAKYEVKEAERHLRIVDDQMDQVRLARDHRKLVLQKWIEQQKIKPPPPLPADHEELRKVLAERRAGKHADHHYAKAMLKVLLKSLTLLNPISAAVLLFGEGLVDIHHAVHMHRVAHGQGDEQKTRDLLEELHDKVETLPPGRAKDLIEKLLRGLERKT